VLVGVLWPATIPRRCSPPPRLGGVLCAVGGHSLASQSQAPSSRSAPPAPRGCGYSFVAGRLMSQPPHGWLTPSGLPVGSLSRRDATRLGSPACAPLALRHRAQPNPAL
jgi:hypothetical protein